MVVPISNGTIGVVVAGLVTNVFGSYYLALFFILLLLIAMCFAFRIPFEFTAILMMPLSLGMAWWTAEIWPVVGLLVLYTGVLMYKYFPVRVG